MEYVSEQESRDYLLVMRDIDKEFPGVKALNKAKLYVQKGSVHALMGENGAGKSTLMKCLFGVYAKDSGEILFEGKSVNYTCPKDALDHGISMVHQELNQVLQRNVMENIWLGRFPTKMGFVDEQKMYDEPTSSLTEKEVSHLFAIIENLRSRGVGMVYISHKMEEIKRISDEITVMRDGSWVYTGKASEMEMDQIISLMVGRSMSSRFPEKTNRPSDNVVLKVERLTGMYKPTITEASFELREGEILGIAGLVGSRRTELVETIFGLRKRESGRIVYKGKEVSINDPIEAISNRFALLTEERRQNGIFGDLSIRFNATISHLNDYCKLSFINEKKMVSDTQWVIDAMAVKTPNDRTAISNLSGGNQQKVIIGRWLLNEPEILMMDEPTRGIDVGAKYEIYKLMNELASKGKSILFVSSEMPELIGVADRILVMSNGRVAGILNRDEFDQEEIMRFAARYLG